jgi:outer membrane protein TolC
MKAKHLLPVLLMVAITVPAALLAQEHSSAPAADVDPPLLTLDDAVSMALTNNRLVKNSELEAQKHDFQVKTIRTQRLPQFNFSVLGGGFLNSFDYTFPAGVFGTYPSVGPIPGKESVIHNPVRMTTFVTGNIDEPITQQYKIGLAIHATELGREIAKEDVRAERQKISAEVRAAYCSLVATQAAVDAANESVQTLEESQRLTARYLAEKTVLRADALEVDARLASARYQLSTAEDGLATQREHLNELLGRDLSTPFRVDPMPEINESALTLEAARQQALQNSPEVRQAQLKERQAEYGRRLAKAAYIPDLSLSVRYMGFNNAELLPQNVTVAGFYLSWDPFDWGRRHNKVAEATRTIEQARNGARETQSQIELEVGMKYRKLQESVLSLKAARTAQEAAAERYRVTENKYREQAVLVKDVLQAQAQNADAENSYQQALSTYWSAAAELRKAMGEE